jgi:hypothetical protein
VDANKHTVRPGRAGMYRTLVGRSCCGAGAPAVAAAAVVAAVAAVAAEPGRESTRRHPATSPSSPPHVSSGGETGLGNSLGRGLRAPPAAGTRLASRARLPAISLATLASLAALARPSTPLAKSSGLFRGSAPKSSSSSRVSSMGRGAGRSRGAAEVLEMRVCTLRTSCASEGKSASQTARSWSSVMRACWCLSSKALACAKQVGRWANAVASSRRSSVCQEGFSMSSFGRGGWRVSSAVVGPPHFAVRLQLRRGHEVARGLVANFGQALYIFLRHPLGRSQVIGARSRRVRVGVKLPYRLGALGHEHELAQLLVVQRGLPLFVHGVGLQLPAHAEVQV